MMKSHGSGISVNINAHDGHGHSCPPGHDVLRVLDIATRDAIPPHHRHEGMWVLVLEEMTFYRLTGGLTNDCWVMCGGGLDHDGGDGDISPDDLPIASKTQKGIVQIGDNINVNADGLIVVPAASDDTAGVVELASAEETKTGTDSSKAVTPAGLAGALVQDKVDNPLPIASKTQKGIVQIGDNISVDVDGLIAVASASDSMVGVVELASVDEAKAGTDTTRAVTPAGLFAALTHHGIDSGLWPLGMILLFPFRISNLPKGWHACNGGGFDLLSAQGQVLNALPTNFKSDWKITTSSGVIYKPNLLTGGTVSGQGPFFRPSNSAPGMIVGDAIRNITGEWGVTASTGAIRSDSVVSGAISRGANKKIWGFNETPGAANNFVFSAANVVPTAAENRPLSVAMTPAIWLGC